MRPWMGNPTIPPYLELIKTALQETRLILFSYINHHGEHTVRTVKPYQLVLKGDHWYLQGYCRERNGFRQFQLCRMSNLQMQEELLRPGRTKSRSWTLTIFRRRC